MRCELVDVRLVAVPDDPDALGERDAAHVARCLRCQAELARYRRLRRELGRLERCAAAPAEGLLEDILDTLDRSGETERPTSTSRRTTWEIVGVVGAAGAIVLANRARARRLAG